MSSRVSDVENNQEDKEVESRWPNNQEYMNWLKRKKVTVDDAMMQEDKGDDMEDNFSQLIYSPVKEKEFVPNNNLTLVIKKTMDTYRIGTPKKKKVAETVIEEEVDSQLSVETMSKDDDEEAAKLLLDGELKGFDNRILTRFGQKMKKSQDDADLLLVEATQLFSEITRYGKSLKETKASYLKRVDELSSVFSP